jgi:type I restriction enzyme, R subunit
VTYDRPEIIGGGGIVAEPQAKVYIAGIDVSVLNERVQYLGANGKLTTGSLKEYTRNGLRQEFRTLDNFLARWNGAEKKKTLIDQLAEHDVILENLQDDIKKDLDLFDLICHIAWDRPALTRRERAEQVTKRDYFTKYGDKARQVLLALLEKYAKDGIENIEEMKVLTIDPFKSIGTPAEIVNIFGGKGKYQSAVKELENEIYRMAV